MCFAHYETHCCRHCLLPLFTNPWPSRYEACFSSVCYGGGALGDCVQRGVQRHETKVYDGSCVHCNPAHDNDVTRWTDPSAAGGAPWGAAGAGEAMRSGFWDSDDDEETAVRRRADAVAKVTMGGRKRRASRCVLF